MVVTLVWVHSWIILAISVCVLLVLSLFLLFCLCWQGKPSKPGPGHFYIVDENGMKTSSAIMPSSLQNENSGVFRKLSNAELWKINFRFPTPNSNPNRRLSSCDKSNLISNEKELMDSLDIEKQFNDAVLEIDKVVENDDTTSCGSNDSNHTYYSVYPVTRANSVAETMRSASSHPENLEKY